jgi:Cys-tRNA(Pro) deacylase
MASMAKEKPPTTQAVRVLKAHGVPFALHLYTYEEHGGTEVAAKALGVDEHMVVKTLVFEDDKGEPLLLLMHGDRQVSTKNLARALNVKTVRACDPKVANKHTGYVVGGISPLGTRKHLRVYVERTIMELSSLVINAGRRGLLAEMSPEDLSKILNPTPVDVAI